MKKKLLMTALISLFGASIFLTSCSKDEDTIAPILSLLGDADITIAKDAIWSDPGFTASDDEDGDITSKVTTSGTVDVTTPGHYHITYTVSDEAGNTSSVERSVTVSWTGAQLAFNYNADEDCSGLTSTYTVISTASSSTFSGVMSGFAEFPSPPAVTTFSVVGNEVTIPTQFPNGAGSDYELFGSGTIAFSGSTITWTINYTVTQVSTSTVTNCTVTMTSL